VLKRNAANQTPLFLGKKRHTARHLGMLAGGTGITPMLQVIETCLADAQDTTTMSLISGNKTESDILLRDRLDELAAKHPKRFKVWHVLSQAPFPKNWPYATGYITKDLIEKHLPPPSEETFVLMCGPPPMLKFACKPALDALGFSKDAQISF
jgi:cytochrome-b5 reductase